MSTTAIVQPTNAFTDWPAPKSRYFKKLDLRSEHPQQEGHRPLSETIAKVQNTYALNDTRGTIVGFWFPEYMKTALLHEK